MFDVPFFSRLEGSKSILIAGCGGGFDVFSGLPLYFRLRHEGYQVHLANLSFSFGHGLMEASGHDSRFESRLMTPTLIKVDARTHGYSPYFPERYLAEWFGDEVPIYTFEIRNVAALRRNYELLVEELALDTVVLIDGGTDSLMAGHEEGLGTPVEDMMSIFAVRSLGVKKFLVNLGFGVDSYHGVCNAHFLRSVAELSQAGGFLGTVSLMNDSEEVVRFRSACEYVFERMPDNPSIVSSSILAAAEGRYGDHHSNNRTAGSQLWINPLMSMYWFFDYDKVFARILYPTDEMEEAESFYDLLQVILRHADHSVKYERIPL